MTTRTFWAAVEAAALPLAYLAGIVTVLLDVFIWRP